MQYISCFPARKSRVVKYEFPDSLDNCSSTIGVGYHFFTVTALRDLQSMQNRLFLFLFGTNIPHDACREVLLLIILGLSRRSKWDRSTSLFENATWHRRPINDVAVVPITVALHLQIWEKSSAKQYNLKAIAIVILLTSLRWELLTSAIMLKFICASSGSIYIFIFQEDTRRYVVGRYQRFRTLRIIHWILLNIRLKFHSLYTRILNAFSKITIRLLGLEIIVISQVAIELHS